MDGSTFTSVQNTLDKGAENGSYNDEEDSDGESNNNAPYLLSNLEVYEILQPRVQYRERAVATFAASNVSNDEVAVSTTKNTNPTAAVVDSTTIAKHNGITKCTTLTERTRKKRQKLLQHRNWIEDEVVKYIQQTAAMEFHSTQNSLPLQSILRRRKRKSRPYESMLSSTNTSKSENITALDGHVSSLIVTDESKMSLTMGFHLTEAEAIQVLNHSPKEMVDLHLYVDQIHERFTIPEQEELLRVIDRYRTMQPLPVVPTSVHGSANATRCSQEGPNVKNRNDPNTNDCLTCNGLDTSNTKYFNLNSLNQTSSLPTESKEYEYPYPHVRSNDITTTATVASAASSSNIVPPVLLANHIKLEFIDQNGQKQAEI